MNCSTVLSPLLFVQATTLTALSLAYFIFCCPLSFIISATGENSFYTRVLFLSAAPLFLIVAIVLLGGLQFFCCGYCCSRGGRGDEKAKGRASLAATAAAPWTAAKGLQRRRHAIISTMTNRCLLITYLVLPSVSTLQFKALNVSTFIN